MVDGGRAGRKVDPTYPLEPSTQDRSLCSQLPTRPWLPGAMGTAATLSGGRRAHQSPPNLVSMAEMMKLTAGQAKGWDLGAGTLGLGRL